MSTCGEKKRSRVCVIGAGPSGMSALYQFGQFTDDKRPDIVCYEKQADWGGLWNLTWRTGTDEFGELCHGSMYRFLWSNGPKEAVEFPDYTFEKHFGKAIPSFPPRAVLRDYLDGRWKSCGTDLKAFIQFQTVVKRVEFNESSNDFSIWIKKLPTDEDFEEKFDFVIVATGIFSTPNVPYIDGLDTFSGRVLHSHDYRDARDFKNQRLLLVGSSYSAEDIALQCNKYGSENIICSWRTTPMGFKWPKGIEERPLVQRLAGNTAFFKDGSSAEIDAVILCTGYLCHYPFLSGNLRLRTRTSLYPADLYKGTVYLGGGNNKLLYIGAQDQYYSFTFFDVEALWACKYIVGDISLPTREEMMTEAEKWVKKLESCKTCHDEIDFQTDLMIELSKESGYTLKAVDAAALLHTWEHHKDEDVCTYRDQSFTSIFTGTKSPAYHTAFMKAYDDSLEGFLKPDYKN